MTKGLRVAFAGAFITAFGLAAAGPPALAQASSATDYRNVIGNDRAACAADGGAATMVTITNVASARGKVRVQAYRGTQSDWLQKGKWLNRVEVPAQKGTMRVCVPLPGPGTYAIAVRHDVNGNGKTDLREDGGGMSNNPSLNILNLGKPSVTKTRYTVGNGPGAITIAMRYM